MKTLHALLAAAAITLVLGAAAALHAGPPPQFWNHKPAATPAPTPAVAACQPAGQACSNCQNCAGCAMQAAPKTNA